MTVAAISRVSRATAPACKPASQLPEKAAPFLGPWRLDIETKDDDWVTVARHACLSLNSYVELILDDEEFNDPGAPAHILVRLAKDKVEHLLADSIVDSGYVIWELFQVHAAFHGAAAMLGGKPAKATEYIGKAISKTEVYCDLIDIAEMSAKPKGVHHANA